jgi:hypothetical protein
VQRVVQVMYGSLGTSIRAFASPPFWNPAARIVDNFNPRV